MNQNRQRVQMVSVDNIMIEAVGARQRIGNHVFKKIPGYRNPVCEMPEDIGMAVVNADIRGQQVANKLKAERKNKKLKEPNNIGKFENFRVAVPVHVPKSKTTPPVVEKDKA